MKLNQISQEHHQQLTAIRIRLPAYPSSLLIITRILLGRCSNLHFICQDHLIIIISNQLKKKISASCSTIKLRFGLGLNKSHSLKFPKKHMPYGLDLHVLAFLLSLNSCFGTSLACKLMVYKQLSDQVNIFKLLKGVTFNINCFIISKHVAQYKGLKRVLHLFSIAENPTPFWWKPYLFRTS